ncbi:Beta-hexosaminidase 2 [Trametes pubescens]|uniref:beta-N-acetylhexosaminidase n=1 Tax=Trametes pubescens TaxID=154538 RepID=A0A1M2V2L2_TRAPU|nr:Beta-hexosaminidase 2 [Trametes pubescens]
MAPILPFALAFCFLFAQHALALWPIPSSLSSGTSAIKLFVDFAIHLDIPHPPADLLSAISRTRTLLHSDTFERLVLGRASADAQAIKSAHVVTSLTVGLHPGSAARSIAEETTRSLGDKDESYELSVPDDASSATLVANTTLGLLRGLTTFEQLWYDSAAIPCRTLFARWTRCRGSRSVTPPRLTCVWLVLTSPRVKLSVLYWHIIDSQSFPLEVGAFPELSAKGAYSAEEVYTREDIQQIVQYANEASFH